MTDAVPISSAAALRAAYRDGSLKPEEVADEVIRRVALQAADHVWINLVEPAKLLDAARRLGARLDDLDHLPLYGVPFAVKDNIDVAGLPTTAACTAYAYLASRSASCVDALVEAGALCVGKTNLDQFATGLSGTRSPYGTPINPLDPELIPGGSSSGSAVAVAGGAVTFALATDTAGSGRVPAALCGIVGLKPAPGWCRNDGVVPACASFDCVSVLATSLDDASAVVAAIAPGPTALGPERRATPAGSGIVAVPTRASLRTLDAHASAAFGSVVGALADLGGVLRVDLRDFFAAGSLLYDGPLLRERYDAVGSFVSSHPEEVLAVTRSIIEAGRRFSGRDQAQAWSHLRALRARTAPLWERVHALVVPTLPTVFTLEEMADDPIGNNAALGPFCHFVNLLGLAAVAVPVGHRPDGRPFGVTVIGPPDRDATLVEVARRLPSGGLGLRPRA